GLTLVAPGEHQFEGSLLHRLGMFGADRAPVTEIAIVVLRSGQARYGQQCHQHGGTMHHDDSVDNRVNVNCDSVRRRESREVAPEALVTGSATGLGRGTRYA